MIYYFSVVRFWGLIISLVMRSNLTWSKWMCCNDKRNEVFISQLTSYTIKLSFNYIRFKIHIYYNLHEYFECLNSYFSSYSTFYEVRGLSIMFPSIFYSIPINGIWKGLWRLGVTGCEGSSCIQNSRTALLSNVRLVRSFVL